MSEDYVSVFSNRFHDFDMERLRGIIEHLNVYGSDRDVNVNYLLDCRCKLEDMLGLRDFYLVMCEDDKRSMVEGWFDCMMRDYDELMGESVDEYSYVNGRKLMLIFDGLMQGNGDVDEQLMEFGVYLNSFFSVREEDMGKVVRGWKRAFGKGRSRKYMYGVFRNYLGKHGVVGVERFLMGVVGLR